MLGKGGGWAHLRIRETSKKAFMGGWGRKKFCNALPICSRKKAERATSAHENSHRKRRKDPIFFFGGAPERRSGSFIHLHVVIPGIWSGGAEGKALS